MLTFVFAPSSSMSAQLSNPHYLRQFNSPNSDLQGGITAAMPAGSFGGALINSWLSDKIGRKYCIILSGWLWVLGCIIQSVSHNVATLVAGRVVAGLAVSTVVTPPAFLIDPSLRDRQVGIASAIVTVYQAEITKPSIRGRIVSIQQLSISAWCASLSLRQTLTLPEFPAIGIVSKQIRLCCLHAC